MQVFVELSAAVHELYCVQRTKNSAENSFRYSSHQRTNAPFERTNVKFIGRREAHQSDACLALLPSAR